MEHVTVLLQGHFDAAQGLAVPISGHKSSFVLSAGFDGVLCLLDTASRCPVWKALLKVGSSPSNISLF